MLVDTSSGHKIGSVDNLDLSTHTVPLPLAATNFQLAIRESKSQPILKRHRLPTDIDGEDSVDTQRKKRRLRVDLFTSRLSQPYATPTTHILSRKTLRLGPWARPRPRARSPLRRVAIMNSFMARRTAAKRLDFKETKLLSALKAPSESGHVEVDLITEGIRTPRDPCPESHVPQPYLPPAPSPLAFCDYDVFDEEDPFDDEDTDNSTEGDSVYSDFNHLDNGNADIEDYDSLSPFSGFEEDEGIPWEPPTHGKSGDIGVGIVGDPDLQSCISPCAR
ncbi:MAG: hypothetical protein Q9174_000872 [Haloplaca sp. 1 TL-2023]